MKKYLIIYLAAMLLGNTGCQMKQQPTAAPTAETSSVKVKADTLAKSSMALKMDSLGLVDIAQADSTIQIKLIYATPHNFMGEILYGELCEAYLHPLAMESLKKAQQLLKAQHPNYSLIVYDAARPMEVQRRMWNRVKGTAESSYVSNPANGGGMHNYGLAVDLTIVDEKGEPLDMGTKFDHFGAEAHIDHEDELVSKGLITAEAKANRELLRRIMTAAGFSTLKNEWWHFNRVSRKIAIKQYQLID